ncbi:MAG: raffinose/stachyose/melibiose transport system permease protein [Petroclostridium sp.]|jgi:raffinose/stachyose/melibiose transport system permease protein|nr:ABC-type sugar transport system, permease component [Clostridia bacterium]MDK2809754.1 raffinose/stachyose/melibiose transport system permease protein [Petroclostridium sp.]
MKQQVLNLKAKDVGKYLLYFFLGVFAFIQLYPFIWLVFFSLKSNSEIFGENIIGLPKEFLWQNYQTALVSGKVGLYFFNSLLVTSITIIISGLLSAMASYAIIRLKWKLSRLTLIIFLLGLMIPLHAALLPLFIIMKQLKLLNTYWSLIIPYVAFAMPMAIYILAGFLQGIPVDMEESALLDGCSIYGTFFRIIVPILRPAIATVSIFTFLTAWNELMFAITFISKQQYRTLTVGINQMVGQYLTHWGPIGAGLVIATLPTILIYTLMSKQVQKSLISGAVKG